MGEVTSIYRLGPAARILHLALEPNCTLHACVGVVLRPSGYCMPKVRFPRQLPKQTLRRSGFPFHAIRRPYKAENTRCTPWMLAPRPKKGPLTSSSRLKPLGSVAEQRTFCSVRSFSKRPLRARCAMADLCQMGALLYLGAILVTQTHTVGFHLIGLRLRFKLLRNTAQRFYARVFLPNCLVERAAFQVPSTSTHPVPKFGLPCILSGLFDLAAAHPVLARVRSYQVSSFSYCALGSIPERHSKFGAAPAGGFVPSAAHSAFASVAGGPDLGLHKQNSNTAARQRYAIHAGHTLLVSCTGHTP